MSYSFHSMLVNGREVELSEILEETAVPQSSFEVSLFSFIQKWHSSVDSFVQVTSGSTGAPKPILITRQQMIASARLTQEALGLREGDSAFLCIDPEYIGGKMMIVRSFITGMRIIAVNPSSNPLIEGYLNNFPIDFTALVPLQLNAILQSEQRRVLNKIRNILVGGAALGDEAKELLFRLKSNVYATYGMTETVSHIALQPLNGPAASEFFTALPGIKISSDTEGCLEIMAPYLAKKITTNDIVEVHSAAQFKWIGRLDNVINSGGVKIIPEKIETKIAKLFGRLQIENRFLVSSQPDPVLGHRLILLVEGISPITTEQLKSSLTGVLHPYEIPKEVYGNIQFVLTKSGKINRPETTRKIGT